MLKTQISDQICPQYRIPTDINPHSRWLTDVHSNLPWSAQRSACSAPLSEWLVYWESCTELHISSPHSWKPGKVYLQFGPPEEPHLENRKIRAGWKTARLLATRMAAQRTAGTMTASLLCYHRCKDKIEGELSYFIGSIELYLWSRLHALLLERCFLFPIYGHPSLQTASI